MTEYLTNDQLEQIKADYPDLYTPGKCPTCEDKGEYRWKGTTHECLCPEQKRLLLRYLHAGIGLTYQRLSWADLAFHHGNPELKPVEDYLDRMEDYIDRGKGLFISGPVGTGKTLLGHLVLKELVKKGVNCYATTFSQTVEAFTAGWSSAEEKQRFAKRFMQSKVLLLDDLGKEFRRSNALQQTTFDHILRTRVQNARPTILTTNMNSAELRSGYGAAVLSLLVEQSIEVPLTGADFRLQAHERDLEELAKGERRPIV